MEFHERMAIAHTLHDYWNPIGEDGVSELLDALSLRDGMRVLDIACGAGRLLRRMGERAAIEGVGVDVSTAALERAREATSGLTSGATFRFHAVGGADFQPEAPFDVVSLVGASWIWGGYAGTLDAMLTRVRPGGLLLLGEPYWRQPPSAEYLAADEGIESDSFTTLGGLHEALAARDLRLVRMRGSSEQEWDRYESLQSQAIDRWAAAHPHHPDRDEVIALRRRDDALYLRWGRETVGFCQFVLRAPE